MATRKYGTAGLFPRHRRHKPKDRIDTMLKEAAMEFQMVGPMYNCNGGSCCISCRRYVDGWSQGRRRILPAECCDSCGRWPIDQALIEKGHLGVQSDPRWAVERLKIADLRTTFAPGDKVIPSQREAASA